MYRDEAILTMAREELQKGRIPVEIFRDQEAVFAHLATAMADAIRQNNQQSRPTLMIVPLGPVGQYSYLADTINKEGLSLHGVTFLNMDEYMWDERTLIDPAHPLSFRGAMQREFYDRVDASLLMPPEQRVFPSPDNAEEIAALIAQNGGVDLCVGGLGINGHVAFNEPQPGMAVEVFCDQPTRVVSIAPETVVVNGLNEYGGAYEFMPRWAVTLGFREIMAAKRIVLGCFRPWHRMVVRKAVAYPSSTEFPITLLSGRNIQICIPKELV